MLSPFRNCVRVATALRSWGMAAVGIGDCRGLLCGVIFLLFHLAGGMGRRGT